MNKTVLSLAIGAAMSTSVAIADGPVPLTENQLDSVTAAGFGFAFFDADVFFDKLVNVDVNVFVEKDTNVFVDVQGYQADANAAANCSSLNCAAETLTLTDVDVDRFFMGEGLPYVTSISESFSAAPPLPENNGGT